MHTQSLHDIIGKCRDGSLVISSLQKPSTDNEQDNDDDSNDDEHNRLQDANRGHSRAIGARIAHDARVARSAVPVRFAHANVLRGIAVTVLARRIAIALTLWVIDVPDGTLTASFT